MQDRALNRLRVLGAVLLLGVLGCSGSDGKVRLAPVTGRVVFAGKPVTSADIYFMPDAEKGNQGKMGASPLQLDGSFTLSTYPDGNGVLPGAYRVVLVLGRRPEKELQKYQKVETTPLEFSVPEEGLRDLDIELK